VLIADVDAAGGEAHAAALGEAARWRRLIILRMSRGALCHLDFSRRTAYGYDERIEVFGEWGRLDSGTPLPLEVVSCWGNTITRSGLHQTWFERVEPTYSAQLAAFIDDCYRRSGEFPNVRDGLHAETIADAAQRFVESQLPVTVSAYLGR
jgi:myo-inositol 2-dehydrogenase/D-chiro-inositol 1-dehydrogenase